MIFFAFLDFESTKTIKSQDYERIVNIAANMTS